MTIDTFYRRAIRTLFGSVFLLIFTACVSDQSSHRITPEINGEPNYQNGYQLGLKIAQLDKENNPHEKSQAFQGLCDALKKKDTCLKDINRIFSSLNITAITPAESKARASLTGVLSSTPFRVEDDYAELNSKRDGVVVLPSSVQYEVLENGDGKKPHQNDTVQVHYIASLPSGKIFDSTYEEKEPFNLKLNDIAIPGLKEVLQLMPVGSKWRVVIPPKMGFARTGKNNRLRRRDVIYEIELLSILNLK